MRVALNGWFLVSPATGTGQYLGHLVAAAKPLAQEYGIDLVVITPTREQELAGAKTELPLLPGNLGKVEFEHITFPRACARFRFDLAHVPHFGPPLFPTVPTIVTIHDLIPMVLAQYRGSIGVRLYTRIAALAARRAAMIIADSENSRSDIVNHLHISPDRVQVIYLAADSRFQPQRDPMEVERVRQEYGLPSKFILYLGGFDVRKNLRLLVDAFGALPGDMRAEWKLVIAGRLPERDTPFFPDPRRGAGRDVVFIGHVKEQDKAIVYSSAGLFAFPSRYEGFGLPPLEAMACGTPVICSSTGSLPEVVGEGGLLLDPSDSFAWTRAIASLLSDEPRRREFREKGLDQAAKFSWDKTARQTLAVYRKAAFSNGPPGP